MKSIFTTIIISLTLSMNAQEGEQNLRKMKLNAGIITEKLAETKAFYTKNLNFGVTFENDFYLLLHTPNQQAELSFLLPNHPTQEPIFHAAYSGKGMYLTIEVEDVDAVYQDLAARNVKIIFEIKDEVWGDRHFAIEDPNGIGIDIVTYARPEEE